jgi:hypothetical protein
MLRCVNRQRAIIFCTAAFLAALIVPGSASAAGYDFPLSGYWPMNEGRGQTVRDWSGNGNNGQLGSTAGADANDPTWIRGIYGWSYGLHFDGNQFVRIPDSSDLEPQSMTVSAWFRGGASSNYRYLVAKGSNQCDSASYGLYSRPNGGIAFYEGDGYTNVNVSEESPTTVWDGKWHNASGTYDGTTVRLFIDGKEVGNGMPSNGRPVGYDTPSGNTTIGAYVGSCDLTFTGDLDEVSIWKKALPIAEIWKKAAILLQPH